jgi:predicted MPP superfamily phosphohydrolase
MILKVLLVLAIILALTVAAHLLVYKSLVRLLIINNPGLKISLLVALVLLALSFMAAFFLLQWQENALTIGFYRLAAVWTALFLNLLLAVLLSWLICAAVWLAGTYPNTRLIAAGCLALAILLTGYGVRNAYHPVVKNLKIEFEYLPDHWQGQTIVQLSDVHLGHFYGPRYLNNLVRQVNSLNPALIFITGDLFDGMTKNISPFAAGLRRFKAEKGTFFITGNHETYIGVHRARALLSQTRINIIKNEVIDIDGLQIIGIGYPGVKDVREIEHLEKITQPSAAENPRIMLFHTPTSITPGGGDGRDYHVATYWVPDTTFSTVHNLGIDLQLSGHTHAGQIFPFNYLTRLIYRGFDHGLRRLGSFSIYTTSGVGTWGPPMRTGNSPEIVEVTLSTRLGN